MNHQNKLVRITVYLLETDYLKQKKSCKGKNHNSQIFYDFLRSQIPFKTDEILELTKNHFEYRSVFCESIINTK